MPRQPDGPTVTFTDDTPNAYRRALAQPFEAVGVPVTGMHRESPAYKSVGPDVGVIIEFTATAVAGGLVYDATKKAVIASIGALRGILAEAPFTAQIRVQDGSMPTEYILPDSDSDQALDAFLSDLASNEWRGGALTWQPPDGWIHGHPPEPEESSIADDVWVDRQLAIGRASRAQMEWLRRQLERGAAEDSMGRR
jgi:hypothetical protein